MFGKKKKDTKSKVIVKTKEELKTAVKRKEPYIEVQGDLAIKMKWMGKLSKKKIAALTALLVVAVSNPVAGTAGGVITANYLVAQGAVSAAESGPVIALIAVLGIVTIIAIFKDYDVEIEANPLKIILTKK